MTDYQDNFDQDDRDEGHVDTRQFNFGCNDPGPHLGCDMDIDVQG